MVLVYHDYEKTVYLPNEYGFLIKWDKIEPPEFYLYNKPLVQIRYTDDFSKFLSGLKEFPDGAAVDWIEQCSAPFSWAMPDNERQRLEDVIQAKGFTLTDQTDGNFIICTCEIKELKLMK
jgi:hypothetical protein